MRNLLIYLLIAFVLVVPVHAQQPTPLPPPTARRPVIDVGQAAEDAVSITQGATETAATVAGTVLERISLSPRSELARALLVLGGLALVVGGWLLYQYIVVISGFLIGGAFAVALLPLNSDPLLVIGTMIVGGAIGGALSAVLYYVAIFLIGAYIGIALTNGLAIWLAVAASPFAVLIGAFIGGAVLLALSVQLMSILAALVGAQMLALGLILGTEWTIALSILGIAIQFVAVRAFGYEIRRRPPKTFWQRRTS